MIALDIPGFGKLSIKHLVSDFSGTLSEYGTLVNGVKEMLNELSESLTLHFLTSDTHGTAEKQLEGVKGIVHILDLDDPATQKQSYVQQLGSESVIAFGNGNNDWKMLREAKISVAVCLAEGLAVKTFLESDIVVKSIIDGLCLLKNPKGLEATLRM